MTRLSWIRLVTGLYIGFLFFVVLSANMGWFGEAFAAVQLNASDKLLHFFLVGGLAFLLNLSLDLASLGKSGLSRVLFQWGTLGLLALATVEELTQLVLPNRNFDLLDLGCNYLGILVLGSFAYCFAKRQSA